MKYCPFCRGPFPDGAQTCPTCGAAWPCPPPTAAAAPAAAPHSPSAQPALSARPAPKARRVRPAPDPGPLSMLDCLTLLSVGLVPLAGPLVLLYWAFSKRSGKGRKALARAMLLVLLILTLLVVSLFMRGSIHIIRQGSPFDSLPDPGPYWEEELPWDGPLPPYDWGPGEGGELPPLDPAYLDPVPC